MQFGISAQSSPRRNGSLKRQGCSTLASFSWTCSIVGNPRYMAAANFASRGGSGRAVVATKRAGPLVNLGLYCRLQAGLCEWFIALQQSLHQHGCLGPHRNKSKWAIMEPNSFAMQIPPRWRTYRASSGISSFIAETFLHLRTQVSFPTRTIGHAGHARTVHICFCLPVSAWSWTIVCSFRALGWQSFRGGQCFHSLCSRKGFGVRMFK